MAVRPVEVSDDQEDVKKKNVYKPQADPVTELSKLHLLHCKSGSTKSESRIKSRTGESGPHTLSVQSDS